VLAMFTESQRSIRSAHTLVGTNTIECAGEQVAVAAGTAVLVEVAATTCGHTALLEDVVDTTRDGAEARSLDCISKRRKDRVFVVLTASGVSRSAAGCFF
jgi:hypothetical protein